MVKTAVIILLGSVFFIESLFPRVELADLLHIPELWSHFKRHQIESPQITFLDFLYLHYGDSNHLAQDAKNHEQLPFSKSHHSSCFTHQIIPELFVVSSVLEYQLLMNIEGVSYSEDNEYSIARPIWQPPKI